MNEARFVRYMAGAGLFVALAALAFAIATWHVMAYRVESLRGAHDRLVGQLNKERTGTGAVLDALGVPGGKIVGEVLDSLPSHEGRGHREVVERRRAAAKAAEDAEPERRVRRPFRRTSSESSESSESGE